MKTFRVLYVDDEADIREVATMSLALDPALEIRDCASGQQALSVAALWQPHLILLDVMMPEMDGPQTPAQLRSAEQTRDIPVVFITARTQAYEIERFLSLGAIGVIAKPFDPMELAAHTRRYLDGRTSER
ncbi:response regulator (plasmid) [Devosia sp. A8/3-2]|nr:response regulator [Devosia sp. A8/3-2]